MPLLLARFQIVACGVLRTPPVSSCVQRHCVRTKRERKPARERSGICPDFQPLGPLKLSRSLRIEVGALCKLLGPGARAAALLRPSDYTSVAVLLQQHAADVADKSQLHKSDHKNYKKYQRGAKSARSAAAAATTLELVEAQTYMTIISS